jgi:two-component system, NarL family, response regulator NreC
LGETFQALAGRHELADRKQRVVVIEGQTLFREGLRALLSSQVDLEVVGEGADGREAIHLAEQLKPDLMLLALSLPRSNGLESLKEVQRVSPDTRILVLATERSEEFVAAALQAGALGYGLKDITGDELFLAVKSLVAGERFLSPSIAAALMARFLGETKLLPNSSAPDDLSVREREILKLVAEGFRTRSIGDFLCISPRTVEKHRANLMKKLDMHSIQALTGYAIRKGMVAHCPDQSGDNSPPGSRSPSQSDSGISR